MALFHGEGTEPGLGRREMRSRRLQVPAEGKEPLPSLGPHKPGPFLPVLSAECFGLLPSPEAGFFAQILAPWEGEGASQTATRLFLN